MWTFPGFFLAYEWWICFGPFGRCKSMNPPILKSGSVSPNCFKKVPRRFVKAPDVPQMVPSLKLTNRKGNSPSNPSVSGMLGMLVSGRVYELKWEFERSLDRLGFCS